MEAGEGLGCFLPAGVVVQVDWHEERFVFAAGEDVSSDEGAHKPDGGMRGGEFEAEPIFILM